MTKNNHFFRNEWKRIAVIFILGILVAVIQVFEPQVTSKIVVSLNNWKTALVLAGISFILGMSSAIFSAVRNRIEIRCKTAISKDIKMDVARHLINSTSTSIKKYGNSERLTSIVCEGDNLVERNFLLARQCLSIITGIFILIYTAIVRWQMFLVFLFGVVIMFFYLKKSMKLLSNKKEKHKTATEGTRNIIREAIDGVFDIKGQLLGSNLKKLFESSINVENSTNVEENDAVEKNNVVTSFFLQGFLLVFFVIGILLINFKQLSAEELITLFLYKNYLLTFVSSVFRAGQFCSDISVSKNRINEVLKYRSVLEKDLYGSHHIDIGEIKGNLSIKGVTVNIEDRTILDNISVDIKSNTFVGIVGQGGCGKSTLLKVLSHDIIPDDGAVMLDGININEYNEYSLKCAIRHAPQTPFVFSMTVRENLQMANSKASEKDLWNALEYADAVDFVKELENGLDTVINRSTLSGSQLQRLALARIPLRNSKIVLLDEATSAMDNITQSRIMSTLKKVTKNHTIIMVAHRIHILKDSDVILYMQNGKIVDKGSYSDLYNRNTSFRKLADEG